MSISFIKSASAPEHWIQDQTTEICLVGRSNVGKSTIINVLANQQIAKTSKTPGRTQLVNFYDFGKYRLVDLPGYGYMVGSHKLKQGISNIINEYLSQRTNLFAVFQVCDANVITDMDIQMSKYLTSKFKNHYVVLNKIDKKTLSVYLNNHSRICNYLKVKPDQLIFISAKNKTNISLLRKTIHDLLVKI
ncbi:MAG: ribosome biogenesis GTP-binding protein YihA/YsxC [Mycoplasmataceae bacterium]|jgi:GTP-binding protein|nr:ribosome biogenesis GTP-binding protein YihA/YsxC [Mycoplasmataceae bacterium]